MKLLLLLGLLLTQPVWAGWTDIGESDTVTLYVDLASINKTASGRSALSLFGYKVPKKDSNSEWLSAVVLNEYDCTKTLCDLYATLVTLTEWGQERWSSTISRLLPDGRSKPPRLLVRFSFGLSVLRQFVNYGINC